MARAYVTDCDCYLPEIGPAEGIRIPSEADIFGPESTLAAVETGPVADSARTYGLTETYAYDGIVLCLFVLTCYFVHSYRSSLAMVFRVLAMRLSVEKVYEEQTLFFRQFIRLTALWGLLLCSGLVIRCVAALDPEGLPVIRSGMAANLVCIAAIGAVACIALYRAAIVGLIAGVTGNRGFFSIHRLMTRIFSAFSYVLLTPFFFIVALTNGRGTLWLLYAVIVLTALLYMLYLTKSYRFFIGRDVSTLQWILYLCTVEIFPVSFFILAVTRNA